jgi:hypothetical protein
VDARVRDKRPRHEGERGGRAFDVEQDHPRATYAGPKQTGSNPLSTPLSV